MPGYAHSQEHLLAELQRIALLLHGEVLRCRRAAPQGGEAGHGLYITEEQVDALLAETEAMEMEDGAAERHPFCAELSALEAHIAQRKAESRTAGTHLRLERLREVYQLTPFDIDALLIGLAPDIALPYETLYAYLQDDLTKKRPSVALVLRLLCPSPAAQLRARQRFLPGGPLLTSDLLHLVADPAQPQSSLLNHALVVDERVVHYLLGANELDVRLTPYAHQIVPQVRLADVRLADEVAQRLARLLPAPGAESTPCLCYFQGPYGVGKQMTAEALCTALGQELVVMDTEQALHAGPATFATTVRLALREARLRPAALYWEGVDALLTDEQRPALATLLRALEAHPGLIFLAGTTPWEPADALHRTRFVSLEFPLPTAAERLHLWQAALQGEVTGGPDVDVPALANRFRLSGGQIRDAVATARHRTRWRDPNATRVGMADLTAACRLQSNRRLATLAQKITPHYLWEDLILPAERLQQLRELCHAMTYRTRVYDDWGFDRTLSLGKGLNALFAGPSGTGKTMAAEVLAGELGLDLYKIDLSTVVSKYIGETEKNLARIFTEATTSNAILFFDEADALFGKRSEVKDAHDRYANIEIGYLLQRMEEYDGVVILATNLRKNLDDAFVRRMYSIIEFPFPTAPDRRRIWARTWPSVVPCSPEVDWDVMAQRFETAGGNIRNIALAAAFLAASDGGVVTMAHLFHATRREYQKLGRVITEAEFAG